MKKLLLLFAGLCFSVVPAFATTGYMTVSSTAITDSTGTLITNATISFSPTVSGIPTGYQINGAGQSVKATVQTQIVSGAFSIQLADVSLTKPKYICYAVTVVDNISGQVLQDFGYSCMQPASDGTQSTWCTTTTCNFDKYTPNLAAQVSVQTGPQGAPGGSLSYPGVSSDGVNGLNIVGTLNIGPSTLVSIFPHAAPVSNWTLDTYSPTTALTSLGGVAKSAFTGLATGLVKNTTGTGALSIAVGGTDYQVPITLTTTGSGAASFSGSVLNIPAIGVGVTYTSPTLYALPAVSSTSTPTVVDSAFTDNGVVTGDTEQFNLSNNLQLTSSGTATSSQNYGSFSTTDGVSYWNGTAPISDAWTHYIFIGTGTAPGSTYDFYGPSTLPTVSVLFGISPALLATSSINYNTAKMILRGATWNGSASQLDDWTFKGTQGTGANPASTLVIAHVGSTGIAGVQVPALSVTGTPLIESGVSTNSDISGELTFSGATTASYTFQNVYLVHPECWVQNQFSTTVARWVTYTSTTSMTINFASAVTGTVSFGCIGRN